MWQVIDKPIFIVGMPRSGTTLVSSILASADELVIAPEIHYLNYWVPTYSFLDLQRDRDYEFFVRKFLTSRRFSYLRIPIPESHSRLLAIRNRDFKAIFETVLERFRLDRRGDRVGEKTPAQFAHVSTLLDWFPDARIVWVLRDPRAVVASLLRAPFGLPVTSLNARKWRDSLEALNKLIDQEKRVLVVKYEDVVLDPDTIVPRLAAELRLTIDKKVANQWRPSTASDGAFAGSKWGAAHRDLAVKPVSVASVRKWEETLSAAQIATIERETGATGQDFGYTPTGISVQEEMIRRNHYRETLHYFGRRITNLRHSLPRRRLWKQVSYRLTGNASEDR